MGAMPGQAGQAGGFVGVGWFAGSGAALNGFYKLHFMPVPGGHATENRGDAGFANARVGAGDE
jgi:hypothetical protein